MNPLNYQNWLDSCKNK